jgi:hypothetical protein
VIRALVLASLLVSASSTAQAPPRPAPINQLAPIVVQLDGVPTGSLVTMLLRDIMRVPYVIAPDLLADRRPMSVRLVIPRHQVPQKVVTFLRNNGMTVKLDGGTIYVSRRGMSSSSSGSSPGRQLQNAFSPGASPAPSFAGSSAENIGAGSAPAFVPLGNPLQRPPARPRQAEADEPLQPAGGSWRPETSMAVDEPETVVAYSPAHRPPGYFSSVIATVLPSIRFGGTGSPQGSSERSEVTAAVGPDLLVMSGPEPDMVKARALVEALDKARPMVSIRATVTQLANVKARGSALSILATALRGNISVGSFAADAPGSQFVRIGKAGLTAVLSAVREDNRFKIVATPNLSALSGAVATLNSGAQVPTVGAVSIAEGGTPVQSIEYRDSGIILNVRPVVRGELIELEVKEERSTFVRTTTGVTDTPTLQKSSATASVVLKSGESVVLAGLSEESDEARREGLLGGLLGSKSRNASQSELLVILTAEIVPGADVPGGVWVEIGPRVLSEAELRS